MSSKQQTKLSESTNHTPTDALHPKQIPVDLPVPLIPEAPSLYAPATINEVPLVEIPSTTTVIISEESFEASTSMDLYRGTVGSTVNDAKVIEKVAPNWLLDYLLYVRTCYDVEACQISRVSNIHTLFSSIRLASL